MERSFACPCCNGEGVIHSHGGETLLECVECDGRGHVDRRHRDELLEWQHKCRTRRIDAGVDTKRSTRAR
jgi:hypothetical protein